MQFNIYFEITSLLFLIVLGLRFFSRHQFPLRSNSLFAAVLGITMGNIVSDIVSTLLLYRLDDGKNLFFILSIGFYFVTLIFLPSALCLYILTLVEEAKEINPRNYTLISIPAVVSTVVFIIGACMGKAYLVVNGTYIKRSFAYIPNISAGIYLVLGAVILISNREMITKTVKHALHLIIFIIAAAAIIQLYFPHLLLTGTAVSLSLMVTFFTLQDPEKMIETTSGALNNAAFRTYMTAQLSRKDITDIVAVEVHGLRTVNAVFGRRAGDALLHDIAEYLQGGSKFRWVFRVGETRFAIVTYRTSDYEVLTEKIRRHYESYWRIGDEEALIRMNACHIKNLERFTRAKSILSIIDVALESDRMGKNSRGIYEVTDVEYQRLLRQVTLEEEIKQALEAGEGFEMYYQPIYNIEEDRFDAAEALLRYQSAEYGKVSPNEFVPMLEKRGYAIKLDNLVTNLVFRDIRKGKLREIGIERIHINLSPASFISEDMVKKIVYYLDEYCIKADSIVFEITERIATDSIDRLEKTMNMFHSEGIKLSMDDFGTGYSNIAQLIKLPFDIVKLDKSLLEASKDVFEDFVLAIRHFASISVAEGIETKEQADLVSSLGIEKIQGFYFARPMPLDAMLDFVKRYNEG